MNAQESGGSPPSPDETGGAGKSFKGLITARDVTMVTVAVALAFGVAVYLHTELDRIRSELSADINEVQTTVQENARDLAVVQTEITALRRDIERLENQAAAADVRPTRNPHNVRGRHSRSPI